MQERSGAWCRDFVQPISIQWPEKPNGPLTPAPDRWSMIVAAPLSSSDHCLVKYVSVFSPSDQDSRSPEMNLAIQVGRLRWLPLYASYPWQVCFTLRGDARKRKVPDTQKFKKNFNKTSNLFKTAAVHPIRSAHFNHISYVGTKLLSYSLLLKRSKWISADLLCRYYKCRWYACSHCGREN